MPRLHINQGIRRKRQYKVETEVLLAEVPGEKEERVVGPWRRKNGF